MQGMDIPPLRFWNAEGHRGKFAKISSKVRARLRLRALSEKWMMKKSVNDIGYQKS